MAPRTTPAKGKGKARAPEVKDEAAIPLGKQLAHTGELSASPGHGHAQLVISQVSESD